MFHLTNKSIHGMLRLRQPNNKIASSILLQVFLSLENVSFIMLGNVFHGNTLYDMDVETFYIFVIRFVDEISLEWIRIRKI